MYVKHILNIMEQEKHHSMKYYVSNSGNGEEEKKPSFVNSYDK